MARNVPGCGRALFAPDCHRRQLSPSLRLAGESADRDHPVLLALALAQALEARSSRVVAYLVVESVPIRNTKHTVPPGERTPGFNLVTCIVPRDGLGYDEFLKLWHTEHREVALETQSTFAYARNEIVRALTPDAPKWAAIVEESFPIEALTDAAVWYAAEGDRAKLDEHRKRMIDSCVAFLALDRIESHPMSEYVYE